MASTTYEGVAVIVPVLNERQNLEVLLTRLDNFQVYVVDDGSSDGTQELCSNWSNVHLIERSRKMGLVSAVLEGFRRLPSGCNYAIVMDSDFSHDPKYIDTLLASAYEQRADLIIGSRYVAGGKNRDTLSRKLISVFGNIAFRSAFSSKIKDATSGFRVYSRSAMDFLLQSDISEPISPSYAGQIDILRRLLNKGMMVIEEPIDFTKRKQGKSKLKSNDVLKFAALILRKGNLLAYVVVGVSGVLVNELILKILFGYMGFPAEFFSIEASVVSNFVLNDRFTFGRKDSVNTAFLSRLIKYNFSSLLAIMVNALIFYRLITMHVEILFANFIGIVSAFMFTYMVSTLFVWGRHSGE